MLRNELESRWNYRNTASEPRFVVDELRTGSWKISSRVPDTPSLVWDWQFSS
jgi:hypothetical protein